MDLLWLKLVHIVSGTVLFGTGLGAAFFLWSAHKSGDARAIAVTARHVVWADLVFTTPAGIVQPATGFWLADLYGHPFFGWVSHALWLYILAGACWLPVLWLQARARDLARAAADAGEPLPNRYHRYMRIWFWLGWPAFLALLGVFYLMVFKPRF